MRQDKLQQATFLARLQVRPEPLTNWDAPDVADMCLLSDGAAPTKHNTATDKQLVRLVENMLSIDDCNGVAALSPREEYAVKQLRQSLTNVDGQYQATCTWAPGGGRPPLNHKQAYNRLVSLELSKYFKDDNLRINYGKVIDDWEKQSFVREVQLNTSQVAYLMPHFPILKDSATTPIRPVMDCKIALNKYLLSGPNLLNNIDDVLLRFRSGLFTFSGDVKQMFLRIKLHPEDRPYHCFLWRSNPKDEPKVYQFQVHVFGNTGSPFVAVFVLREHAIKYADTHPQAVDTITNSSLIDDILDSADSPDEARTIMDDLWRILQAAGMQLAKCHSNSSYVLQGLPQEAVTPGYLDLADICQKDSELLNLKALGMRCNPTDDQFYFEMEKPLITTWTKRAVLKTFPRLFDPLGLLLPYTIRARIYFSYLVLQQKHWDTVVPLDKQWASWLEQLGHLGDVRFPRCIKLAPAKTAELHVFCDASEKAFAAAAYLLTVDDRGSVTVRLARAKAHVAPLKRPQTIPRLELLAAELSTSLRLQVVRAVKLKIVRCVHWTDSTTVLCWINDDKRRFQTFVYNKINNIRRVTVETEWRYVPTSLNPADLPSRGTSVAELAADLWQHGPDYLRQGEAFWPPMPELIKTSAVLQELRKIDQVFTANVGEMQTPSVVEFDRFSSWERLVAMGRLLFRYVNRWRRKRDRPEIDDVNIAAVRFIVLQAQKGLKDLLGRASKSDRRRAGFLRVTPFQDEDGVWRGLGRLSAAEGLARDARLPILLHKSMPVLRLVMLHLHEKVAQHYGGPSYLLAQFFTKYWAPDARRVANAIVHNCVSCKRQKAKPCTQVEGLLPEFRVVGDDEDITPFASTGMDCAGPYRVKRGRAYETYYLLIMTCCKIRAVRLELLDNLNLDALLMALTRAATRGVNPTEVVTDNGANFEAASALMQRINEELQTKDVQERRPEVKWRFNPPYASHYGGVFERMVKATKEALYHALPSHMSLSLEQLRTALAVVESILNSRPLAYVSTDPKDPLPLTPNHFLHGSPDLHFYTRLRDTEVRMPLATKFNVIRRAMERYMERFKTEVRPFMALNNKAVLESRARDVEPGDVVAFFMPSAARKWPLALVTDVYPGRDGKVRTVRLRLPQHNSNGDRYDPSQKSFVRDVREVAVLLPAETARSL